MKFKKIILDMGTNIVASVIPVAVLQLFVLPQLSLAVGEDKYGLILTIIALFNVVPATFGNVLNNIRLLHNNEYEDLYASGDFNYLVFISECISGIVVIICTWIYLKSFDFISLVLVLVVSILWLAREYYVVAFRIELNYIAILIDNVLLSIGHVTGFFVFKSTELWQFVYLCGYLFSLIYILMSSKLWKEPFRKTHLFKITLQNGIILLGANILNRLMTYADKLLLYPLLGGVMVSIYYAASVFSKLAALAITPMTSVILSYISKLKKCPSNIFKLTFRISFAICVFIYILCLIIAEPILAVIYPQYVNVAVRYIPITSLAMVFSTLTTVINPFIMRFFNLKWQIKINGFCLAIYVSTSYILLHFFGLYGFCIGIAITNMLKTLFLVLVYKIEVEKG